MLAGWGRVGAKKASHSPSFCVCIQCFFIFRSSSNGRKVQGDREIKKTQNGFVAVSILILSDFSFFILYLESQLRFLHSLQIACLTFVRVFLSPYPHVFCHRCPICERPEPSLLLERATFLFDIEQSPFLGRPKFRGIT